MNDLHRQGTIQMRENCKRDLPWFAPMPAHDGKFVIVGGGPSLRSRIEHVRGRKRRGECIVACNGAAGMLHRNGITPDVVVFVDPSEVVAGFVGDAPFPALYLVASVCHPRVFEKLEGQKAMIWHADNGIDEQKEILNAYPDKPVALIGGGNTGALRAMVLGYLMGFRALHLYGFDSSYADDGADHAYTKHDGVEPHSDFVFLNGKRYRCAAWMARQAEDFKYWYAKLRGMHCKVFVHGEGLIPDIYAEMNRMVREKVAA